VSRYLALAAAVAAPTFALLVVLTQSSHHHRQALAAYVLALGALALVVLVAGVRGMVSPVAPSLFDTKAPRREAPRLVELEQLRSRLMLARSSAGDFHYRLRPQLWQVATTRLQRRYGFDPAHDQERAQALLGERAWSLLRPDRSPPPETHAPGMSTRDLRALVETLEQI
jgi:hypothetical protein